MLGGFMDEARKIAAATGLPEDWMIRELEQMANQKGSDLNQLDIDGLRELAASYLQDVLLNLKNNCESLLDE